MSTPEQTPQAPVIENQVQEELSDEQLKEVAGGTRPPSGDLNPSDLINSTVDTTGVIDPQPTK